MDHKSAAEDLFMQGYNCAQSVLCAFEDVTGLDRETSAKIASSFGAGMGRMREVCGGVSGALMVLGIAKGYSDPKASSEKNNHYALVREFMECFKKDNGSIICRELLEGVAVKPGPEAEERTEEYYKKRPCPELVAYAAGVVEKMLEAD